MPVVALLNTVHTHISAVIGMSEVRDMRSLEPSKFNTLMFPIPPNTTVGFIVSVAWVA